MGAKIEARWWNEDASWATAASGLCERRKENIEMVAVVDRDFRFERNKQAEQTGTQDNLFNPLDGDHMKLAMPSYSLRFLVPFFYRGV
jgi:hypothetical protein